MNCLFLEKKGCSDSTIYSFVFLMLMLFFFKPLPGTCAINAGIENKGTMKFEL